MQKDELEHKTLETELDALRAEMLNKLAKEHHWDKQEKHWDRLTVIAVIAVLINGLKPFWEYLAKYLFTS